MRPLELALAPAEIRPHRKRTTWRHTMRITLPILLACLCAGCCYLGPCTPKAAYRYCPMAKMGVWHALDAPPSNARALLAIATPDLSTVPDDPRIGMYWFEIGKGRLMWCRAVRDNTGFSTTGCPASSWQFEQIGGGWQAVPNAAPVESCG